MERHLSSILFKVYLFFFGLLVVSLLSILLFHDEQPTHKEIGTEVPNIEINNFMLSVMSEEALQMQGNGSRALRYSDKEVIYNLHINQKNKDILEYMSAHEAINKNNTYFFPQGVEYNNTQGIYFWSESGVYDARARVFSGQGKFNLKNNDMQGNGVQISYDALKNAITAHTIQANINMGK